MARTTRRSQSSAALSRVAARRRLLIVAGGAVALAALGVAHAFAPAGLPAGLANGLWAAAVLLVAACLAIIMRLDVARCRAEHRLRTTIRALRNKDSRLRHALDGAHEGWWDWDAAHGGTLVSARTREIFALDFRISPGRIAAQWRARVHPQDIERVDLAVSRHVRYDVALDTTYRIMLPAGVLRWVRMRGQAQRDERGKLTSISGFVADVTEKQLAENAQACLAARHASVVAALPDLMIEIDEDGRYLRYHAGNEDDLVVPPAQLLGRHIREVLPAAVVEQVEGAFCEVRESGGCAQIAFELDTQKSAAQAFEARIVRIDTGGYLCIVRNITERKAAEQELVRHRDNLADLVAEQTIDLLLAKEAAERGIHSQREFLATLSHELRTPLHAILGFAEMGRAPDADAARRAHLFERIEQSGERLLKMVSGLLDMAGEEAAREPMSLSAVDWAAVCDDVLRECEALVGAKHLTVDREFGDKVCAVHADGPRLRQVVTNLLTNAIKFSPDGATVVMRLRNCQPCAGDRHAVILEVEDSGIGLPANGVEQIFDAFVRGNDTDAARVPGSGLGLAICRQTVETFGGAISAHPAPGGGALFRVELSCAAARGAIQARAA